MNIDWAIQSAALLNKINHKCHSTFQSLHNNNNNNNVEIGIDKVYVFINDCMQKKVTVHLNSIWQKMIFDDLRSH